MTPCNFSFVRLIKKVRQLFLSLFLLSAISFAQSQTTTVTATVTDPNGVPYAGGMVDAILSAGTYTSTNGTLASPVEVTATLDSTGSFSVALLDDTQLLPTGSTWTFNVCAANGITCFSVPSVTISGTSQSITTTLNASAPVMPSANKVLKSDGVSVGGGSITGSTCADTQVTVTGAVTGMGVAVSPVGTLGANWGNIHWAGYISAANTVQIRLCNNGTTTTPAAQNFNIRLIQ